MKDFLKIIIKFSIASGLIYWLVKSDKLSLKELKLSLESPMIPLFGVIALIGICLIAAFRWRIILSTKTDKALPMKNIFTANWIGSFFNTVVPGSVSGDILKIFYVQNLCAKLTKKFLLFSVFIDRLVGLFALITIGAISGIYNLLTQDHINQDLLMLIILNILVTLGVALFFILLYVDSSFLNSTLKKISTRLQDYWQRAITHKKNLMKMYLISFLVQGLVITIFWLVSKDFAQGNFNLLGAYTVIPFGFIIMAIPIAPAGIGVGHFAFQKLFAFLDIANGASLFNIYFCVFVIANLTGVIPYILYRKSTIQK